MKKTATVAKTDKSNTHKASMYPGEPVSCRSELASRAFDLEELAMQARSYRFFWYLVYWACGP